MITVRCVRRFGEARPVDLLGAAELRAWLLELRATLSPESWSRSLAAKSSRVERTRKLYSSL